MFFSYNVRLKSFFERLIWLEICYCRWRPVWSTWIRPVAVGRSAGFRTQSPIDRRQNLSQKYDDRRFNHDQSVIAQVRENLTYLYDIIIYYYAQCVRTCVMYYVQLHHVIIAVHRENIIALCRIRVLCQRRVLMSLTWFGFM